MSMRAEWDWPFYYDNTDDNKDYQTLTKALEYWRGTGRAPGFAVDLGCGTGADTIRLLEAGWHVLGVDGTEEGLKRLRERPDLPQSGVLETLAVTYEVFEFPRPADLINASYALPFCTAETFPAVWEKIKAGLTSGGVFCGHFFGDRDDWVVHKLILKSKQQVKDLLQDLEIYYFEEVEEDAVIPSGRLKHWHVFDVVAYEPSEN